MLLSVPARFIIARQSRGKCCIFRIGQLRARTPLAYEEPRGRVSGGAWSERDAVGPVVCSPDKSRIRRDFGHDLKCGRLARAALASRAGEVAGDTQVH